MYRIIETISLSSFSLFCRTIPLNEPDQIHWKICAIAKQGNRFILRSPIHNPFSSDFSLPKIFRCCFFLSLPLFLLKPWRRFNESFRPFFSCWYCCRCCLLSQRYLSSGCLSIDDTPSTISHMCANIAGRFISMILKMLTQTFQIYKPMCITHIQAHK